MPYVSCMYSPPLPPDMTGLVHDGNVKRIQCIDDKGAVWHITEDSKVEDWLRYVKAGGKVTKYKAPEPEPSEGI